MCLLRGSNDVDMANLAVEETLAVAGEIRRDKTELGAMSGSDGVA